MLPDIDSLALFSKAAEFRSLTKAAEAMNMSLGAASRRIALLEHKFKTTLFERTSRGINLTPAAEELLEHVQDLLININNMQSQLTAFEAGSKGVVKVMATTSVLSHLFPRDLADFLIQNPGINVNVSEHWSSEVIRGVLSSNADVGLLSTGLPMDGLEVHTYGFDRLCIIFTKGHPLAKKKEINLADLLDYDLITLEASSNITKLLLIEASKLEKAVRIRIQVKGFEAVIRMAKAGLGIGVVLFPVNGPIELPGDDLICKPIEEDWAKREIVLCYKKNTKRTHAMVKFIDFMIAKECSI